MVGPGKTTSLIRVFLYHPNAANLLMALMILFGLYALTRINTQFFPSVDQPNIVVNTVWPGASAKDIETNILAVIEPEIRYLEGVNKVTSTAREGVGTVVLEFDEGADMPMALSETEAAVKAINNLPEDAETPTIRHPQFFDPVGKILISGDISETALRLWARRIRDELIARGIDKVEFTGFREREMLVEITARTMRRIDMGIAQISDVIAANSRDLPSGNIEGTVQRQLRAMTDIATPAALRKIEVKSFHGGEKIHLGDIASVGTGFEDGTVQGFSIGRRSIELDVRRAPTADTLKTSRILDDYVNELRPLLPDSIDVRTYEVAADALSERIMLLVRNGLGGLVIVVATLFLFLHVRIAVWVAAGIPVAMLATLAIMYATGQSINMISLFALIMMLGVIVDDAIVVGEHTATRIALGESSSVAAGNGASMMLTPILAAMITTMASFAPIALITGAIGQIMVVMPLVVIAVLVASLVECFLVLPGHLAHSLRRKDEDVSWSHLRQFCIALSAALLLVLLSTRESIESFPALDMAISGIQYLTGLWQAYPVWLFWLLIALISFLVGTFVELAVFLVRKLAGGRRKIDQVQNREGRARHVLDAAFNRFGDGIFAPSVRFSYRWRYVTIAIAVGLVLVVVVGLLRSNRVEFVLFPSPEAENIFGVVIFNAGTPEAVAISAIKKIETSLYNAERQLVGTDSPLVRAVFAKLGQAGPNRSENLAELRVQLTSSEMRTIRTADIVNAWRDNVPPIHGVQRFVVVEVRAGPPGRDVDILLQGGSAETLKVAAGEVTDILAGIAGISGIEDNLPYGKPEVIMEMLPRGAALGFSMDEVGRQVRNAFQGAIPRRFVRDSDEITIRVVQKMPDNGTAAFHGFELKIPGGGFTPLTEVVSLRPAQGFSAIQRQDGMATVSITADIDTTVNTTDRVIAQLESSGKIARLAKLHGLEYRYAGRAEEQSDAFADLGVGTLVALTVIYIVLAWVFASYWLPFAIMLIIPFGLVGAVFGHWVLGYQMTVLSMIGLLGLAGILVNDSIILVSRVLQRSSEGDLLEAAVIGASRDRLRAVLLTSLTTIGGLMPLMYEKSLQAQFLLPMVITMIFGLGLATLLVLFLVPSLIGIGDDARRFLSALFGSKDPDGSQVRGVAGQ